LRLKEIADIGFSPWLTSISGTHSVLSKRYWIREEEVEENIALNTLGTIIHETLKSLYDPFVGRFISESDIQNCFKQIDDESSETVYSKRRRNQERSELFGFWSGEAKRL
jgi:hypothetical protein